MEGSIARIKNLPELFDQKLSIIALQPKWIPMDPNINPTAI